MEFTPWWEPHWHWAWIVLLLFMIPMIVCAVRMIRCAGQWRRSPGRYAGCMRFGCCQPGRDSTKGEPHAR